jgi:NAD-dependent SIR2 family protein deacetylase
MIKGLHEDKKTLYCNQCEEEVDKWTGTQVLNSHPEQNKYGEVYCLSCGNWLCGEFDAFGEPGRFHYFNPAIRKLEQMRKDLDEIIKYLGLNN